MSGQVRGLVDSKLYSRFDLRVDEQSVPLGGPRRLKMLESIYCNGTILPTVKLMNDA